MKVFALRPVLQIARLLFRRLKNDLRQPKSSSRDKSAMPNSPF